MAVSSPFCCHIPLGVIKHRDAYCENPPRWELFFSYMPGDDTMTCEEHIGEMIPDGMSVVEIRDLKREYDVDGH